MEARTLSAVYGDFIADCYRWDYFGCLTLHPEWSNTGQRIMAGQVHRFFWLLFHLTSVRAGGAVKLPDVLQRDRFSGPLARAYRNKRGRFVYVFALEHQRRGALHAHFLLYVPRYFDHRIEYRDVRAAWPYGGNKVELPRIQADVTEYVGKYIAKDGDLYFSESFESDRLSRVHDARSTAA